MNNGSSLLISLLAGLFFAGSAIAQEAKPVELPRMPSPKGVKVYVFGKDGREVAKKFKVAFGLKGMGIAPAGIKQDNTGHHHLLIDVPDDKMPPMNLPLAATDNIKHFGAGQTETILELPPGKHTLQLVFADHLHIPHDPPVVSKRVTVNVKE